VRAADAGRVQMQGQIAYTVAFDLEGPAMGESVRSSFHMIGNGVKSIVQMLVDSTQEPADRGSGQDADETRQSDRGPG
jgi:hypothetical protein